MATEQTITVDMRLLRAVWHHASTDGARPGLCGVQVLTDGEGSAVAYLATDGYTLATAAPAAYVETWRAQMCTTLDTTRLIVIRSSVIKAAKPIGPGLAVLTFAPREGAGNIGTWTWTENGGKGASVGVLDIDGSAAFPTVGGLLKAELVPFGDEMVALNGDYLARWADSALEMVRHEPAKRRITAPVRLLGLHGTRSDGMKAPVRVEIKSEIGSVFGLHMPARVDV